jgi:hypothetical protein
MSWLLAVAQSSRSSSTMQFQQWLNYYTTFTLGTLYVVHATPETPCSNLRTLMVSGIARQIKDIVAPAQVVTVDVVIRCNVIVVKDSDGYAAIMKGLDN